MDDADIAEKPKSRIPLSLQKVTAMSGQLMLKQHARNRVTDTKNVSIVSRSEMTKQQRQTDMILSGLSMKRTAAAGTVISMKNAGYAVLLRTTEPLFPHTILILQQLMHINVRITRHTNIKSALIVMSKQANWKIIGPLPTTENILYIPRKQLAQQTVNIIMRVSDVVIERTQRLQKPEDIMIWVLNGLK